jgi:transposase
MLSLSPATRVFLALAPIDGRKGFNGLYTLVKETLQQEPTSGFFFVFLNKRRNRLKILTYDGSGLWLLTKRLDRGTYAAPAGEGRSVNLRPEDDLTHSRHREHLAAGLAPGVKFFAPGTGLRFFPRISCEP